MPSSSPLIGPERPGLAGRSWRSKFAVAGVAVALVAAPALVGGTAADAAPAPALTITNPSADQVLDVGPTATSLDYTFRGGNLPAGDFVVITYTTASDQTAQTAANTAAQTTGNADGSFSTAASFAGVTDGESITALVRPFYTSTIGTPVLDTKASSASVTFSVHVVPAGVPTLVVTSPTEGQSVTLPADNTVAFTGENLPAGDFAVITYPGADGTTETAANTAGQTAGNADGTFTTQATFADLAPGQTSVTALVRPFYTSTIGTPVLDTKANSATVTFTLAATAPAANPTLTLDPETVTVSQALNPGVTFSVTGFGASEDLQVTVKDPAGNPITLAQASSLQTAADGSYSNVITLLPTSGTGTYTVTVTGATSGLTASGTFTVVPDPVTTGTGTGTGTGVGTGSLPVVSG